MGKELVEQLAKDLGGEIKEMAQLPDGSGFAVMTMPLPKDHWIYQRSDEIEEPPAPWRMGRRDPRRSRYEKAIREAAQYAIRGATMHGAEMDFDPDALVQNLIVGMLGYWTHDGFSHVD